MRYSASYTLSSIFCLGIALWPSGAWAQVAAAPRIVATEPAIGASGVDPGLAQIRVTFDQDMAEGFSWTGGGEAYPETTGKPKWENSKTCVLPVKLAPGTFYRVGINSSSHRNFQNASGAPAEFAVIYFATEGADAETVKKLSVPKIVSMEPANGAGSVSASVSKLVVTFDRPMGGGASWTKAGGTLPEGAGQPEWNEDHTIATLPVKLAPNVSYTIGLNHAFANNFQTEHGVPLAPVVWSFTTGAE